MLYSMTGFGRGVVQNDKLIVETEIKSFNSRFLDLGVKLPKNLSSKEFEIREKLKKKIKRGKLLVNVFYQTEKSEALKEIVDTDALKGTVGILEKIKDVTFFKDKVTLSHLLDFKNLYLTDNEIIDEEQYGLVEESLDIAIDELIKMRKKEGDELKVDFEERLNSIEKAVDEVENINKNNIEEYFNKLKERAVALLDDSSVDENRLHMELAFLAEKYDVTEECVRIKSHIKLFRDSLVKGEEAGRKMNFICQELNREANTISSKAVTTEVSHLAISIKEELEKIREQIQNIE